MNLDLSGKQALVCGSSKGIGKAAAQELAALGANVTLVARSADTLAALCQALDQSKGQQHDFIQADFSDIEDLKAKLATLTARKNIHILVNNSGGPAPGPIVDADLDAFTQAMQQHLLCNHVLVQATIPGMRADGYGRIINVISTSVKAPLDGLGVSNTVRAAVANWAKTLANELGPDGITVNNVLPGFTNTQRLEQIISRKAEKAGRSEAEVIAAMKQQVPLRRFADPTEQGAAVAFLASPAAAYITGTNLTVDGGRTRSW